LIPKKISDPRNHIKIQDQEIASKRKEWIQRRLQQGNISKLYRIGQGRVSMHENKIKAKMKSGNKAYGCRFLFPSVTLIELTGIVGFDYIFLDGEHGVFTLRDIEEICRTADQVGLTPIARVPNIRRSTILQFLDRGIMGVMGPHIITRSDAEELTQACLFTPQGNRSFGSGRGNDYAVSAPGEARRSFMAKMNKEILIIALLEDVQALDNLSEILGVEHIDLFAFGPNDLAQSMKLPGEPNHPRVLQAIEKASVQIRAAGKKIRSEVMVETRANELFLKGGQEFLRKSKKKS
jgi:4-hydroxy-2-oxoheptanedioate aldolase